MFKSWRNDKKKIKAVFKLQFQATQVPKLKKPALILSLVPEDVGKTTFKLEKAAVQNGICTWENPIYVTVKLIKELKTGKLHEKIYSFIVSSGSSKSGYLGEASIDFADFAEETEPLAISVPLKFANSGAVLNVTIQRLKEGTDKRYIEDNEDLMLSQDRSLNSQLSNDHIDGDDEEYFAEDRDLEDFLLQNAEQNGSFKASIDSNSRFQSTVRQNSIHQRQTEDASTTKNCRISSTDSSVDSASDGSLVDPTISPEDNLPIKLQEASDETIEKLKSEISSLHRQSELSELELQSLRKQVTKETKRAQYLSSQIIDVKEERDALKVESEQLKSSKKHLDRREAPSQLQSENEDLKAQLEEKRRELSHEQELKTNLQLQLQKTQDSNSELILAVTDLEEVLEKKNTEISRLSSKLELSKKADEVQVKRCKCNIKEVENQHALAAAEELARDQNNVSELYILKKKITDLSDELVVHREDKENFEKYIEQLTQDYEDLKQENYDFSSRLEQSQLQELKREKELSESLDTIKELELQVERLEEKLRKQTLELSESLDSINELESEVKGLEKELEKQAQEFGNDLDAMTHAKVEQEQRAIRAEETLRTTRWKNAVTAEHLQEEFRKLSMEMAGKFDENEKLMMKALTEADELRAEKKALEERLQKANEDLALIEDQNSVKLEELSTQLDLQTKHIEQMSWELQDKTEQLRYAQKCGEENKEAFSMEIQILKTKIETLTKQKNNSKNEEQVSLTDELEETTSSEERETLAERWNRERGELERKFTLAKKEAEKAQEELLSSRHLKETMTEKLLSELESLRAQHTELKHRLSRKELEEETLQKQVLQLKVELQKKENKSTSKEQLLNKNGKSTLSNSKNLILTEDRCAATVTANVRGHEEQEYMKETLLHSQISTKQYKLPEEDISVTPPERYENNLNKLLAEMALLRERNQTMEAELKEMQERYSELSLKFAEVEGERQQLVMTVRNLRNGKKN